MLPLTEAEYQIVQDNNEPGFGAWLQYAWWVYPDLLEEISKESYPDKQVLVDVSQQVENYCANFNICYLYMSPEEIAVLNFERSAWILLSPIIAEHLKRLNAFLEDYDINDVDQQALLLLMQQALELIEAWNVISNSYKAKSDKEWKLAVDREEELKQLIDRLQQS